MKKLMIAAILLVAYSASAQTVAEQKHLTFGAVKIQEVDASEYSMSPMVTNFADCNQNGLDVNNADNPLEIVDESNLILDVIINMGKKIWALVEMGRPVVNIKTDSANALPQGIICWQQLAGWTPTQAKVYKVSYENLYGIQVVEFAFRLVYTTGGNYKGTGQYITNTTIIPATVNVAWGYKFNANSEVPTVFNVGTSEAPVGGMQLNVKWAIDTVMNYGEESEVFYVGGDGSVKHLD